MLGKLCKYEFRSICRTLFPIYIAALAVSVLMSITLAIDSMGKKGMMNNFEYEFYMGANGGIYEIFKGVIAFAYFAIIVALFVITTVIILQRFYKGLLGDEGYLMFTLPVKTWELITSKGIVAIVMSFASLVVSALSIFIIGVGAIPDKIEFIKAVLNMTNWYEWIEKLNYYYPRWPVYTFEVIILMIVFGIASLYQIYVSISLGHMAKKHRVMMSVVAYIVISVALSFLNSMIITALDRNLNNMYIDFVYNADAVNAAISTFLISNIIFGIIQSIVCFIGTERILSKELNLE